MQSETGGVRFNPEAQPNPYAQIPDLVRRSISPRPKNARRAQRQLFHMISSDRYFDPALIAVAEAQKILLKTKDKGKQTSTMGLIREVFYRGMRQGEAENEFKQELVLRANDQVIQILGNIASSDKRIQTNKFLQQSLHNNYKLAVDSIPGLRQDLQGAKEGNLKEIRIPIAGVNIKSPNHFEQVRQQAGNYNEWIRSLPTVLVQEEEGVKDTLIDLVKSEPDHGQEKLLSKKGAEVTLEDIEVMEYPLSEENFLKITVLLTEALSNDKLTHPEALAIQNLFFVPTFFLKPSSGPIVYRNHNLLANLNSWQELFADSIVFSQSPKIDEQLKSFLQRIKADNALSIFMPIACSSVSLQMDPDNLTIDPQQFHILSPRHPILVKAIDAHVKDYQEQGLRFVYAEEIVGPYLMETVLPLLERRLEEFGVGEKFKKHMNNSKEFVEENDFSSRHLQLIKEIFEKNSGSEFLEKINLHTEDIQEITRNVWKNVLENIHFLPMQEGVNIIEFSEDSVPSTLGLKALKMVRVGSQQDWNINISFTLQNTTTQLIANLNQLGKLEFKAPLEQEIPGLYTMLNHIAVLTFHDLVVQEKKEREGGSRMPTGQLIQQESNVASPEKDNGEGKEEDFLSGRSQVKNLPRIQRDRQLITDVYHATNREPRRVELHDRFLPGAREYQAAVELYQEATTGHVSEEAIDWTRTQLEEARAKAFRISEGKKLNAPAKFQLPAIQDPITGEIRYLKTWVIEHSNPKPTPEELQSPVKLYERYYRNSSALASLDQMKPWFIGQ